MCLISGFYSTPLPLTLVFLPSSLSVQIASLPSAMSFSPVAGHGAGTKRLLPPFEPSSPGLPLARPAKRLARKDDENDDDAVDAEVARRQRLRAAYPTPLPTSSTALLSSSPPPPTQTRSGPFSRTSSSTSERAPLSAVPTLMLPADGSTVRLGRSSVSCDHTLSASRLISRVHVTAAFRPAALPLDDSDSEDDYADEQRKDRIEVLCCGWNGITLHCQGRTYELTKGKTFTSDIADADILIDVQDARVLVQWPQPRELQKRSESMFDMSSECAWDRSSPPPGIETRGQLYHHDSIHTPPRHSRRLSSPVSPSPASRSLFAPRNPVLSPNRTNGRSHGHGSGAIVVYEDRSSPLPAPMHNDMNVSQLTQLGHDQPDISDYDEENDPSVQCRAFGASVDAVPPSSPPATIPNNTAISFTPPRHASADLHPQLLSQSKPQAPFRPDIRARSRGRSTAPRSRSRFQSQSQSQSRSRPRQRARSPLKSSSGSPRRNSKQNIKSTMTDEVAKTEKTEWDDEQDVAKLTTSQPPADKIASVPAPPDVDVAAIRNHVVNQLVFSRLSTTPLSEILEHLPAAYWRKPTGVPDAEPHPKTGPSTYLSLDRSGHQSTLMTRAEIRALIDSTPCIGFVDREGTDAAGKPLESEYYYIPEYDEDEGRRGTVVNGLRRPGLRNCRKQHKVCLPSF